MKKLVFLAMAVFAFASVAGATTFLFSNSTDVTLNSVTYQEGDLIEYNTDTGGASLYFSALASGWSSPDIDAVHVLSNGNIILSMESDETYGGVTYENGSLVEFNPVNNEASLYFNVDLFSSSAENIDAMSLTPTGNLILSTSNLATLGGLGFGPGDLVEYDPIADVATLLFDGDNFKLGEDIDAVHFLANGNVVLSTENDAIIGFGTNWQINLEDGDLIEYNVLTGTASLYFDESEAVTEHGFDPVADVDAVYIIPEPMTVCLLGLGGLMLRKKK